MKILFFGTPQIAVSFLEALLKTEDVVGVVCQPDRPAGRGYELQAPPTKIVATQKNVSVFQPEGKWTDDQIAQLKNLGAEVGIVVAYGRIMPRAVFDAPKLGCINLHFSLLPKYRGAAPMQWALVNGEKETGVSAFWLDEKMDAGPLFHQRKISVSENDSLPALRERLIACGQDVLNDVLNDLKNNVITKEPQSGEVTLAALLKKEDGRINWSKSASEIHNLVRGLVEWPTAQTTFSVAGVRKNLKILSSRVDLTGRCGIKKPGEIIGVDAKSGLSVATGEGLLQVLEVQPEGGRKMDAWSFWNGSHLKEGDNFE